MELVISYKSLKTSASLTIFLKHYIMPPRFLEILLGYSVTYSRFKFSDKTKNIPALLRFPIIYQKPYVTKMFLKNVLEFLHD